MNRHVPTLKLGRATLLCCAALTLVACNEAQPLFKKKPTSSTSTSSVPKAATKFKEKDVEAPQVFQKTAKALWDGRPSLGGVWVAHPDNKTPERVIIRNKANGKSVIGALFNRERSLPGPAFQLSSDAAIALGVPAGTSTELSVTAMRVEKTPIATKSDAPKAAPSKDIATETLEALEETTGTAEKPTKKISKWKARKLAREAEKATATSGGATTKNLPRPQLRDGRKTVSTAKSATPRPKATAKAVVSPPKPPAAAPTKPSIPKTNGKYAQLGLFSIESNAKATLEKVKAKNLAGKIVEGNSNGKKYYRVLAGPAITAAEQKKILSIVKSMGFNDAYLVKG